MTTLIPHTRRRRMSKADMTADIARALLNYDPETGELTWKVRRSGTARKGARAGCAGHWNGYRVVALLGRQWQEHVVAWLLFYGVVPTKDIDHINGNRADNRIVNLRECTPAENAQNMAINRDNTSGFMGVHLTVRGVWRAQIKKDGLRHYLGDFDTPEEASAAYLKAKRILHPFNPVPREVRRG